MVTVDLGEPKDGAAKQSEGWAFLKGVRGYVKGGQLTNGDANAANYFGDDYQRVKMWQSGVLAWICCELLVYWYLPVW